MIINGGNPLKDCPTDWEQAREWEQAANAKKEDAEPVWSWDCGFKLDYDAPGMLEVSARFYPPKSHYGDTWDGTMKVSFMGEKLVEKDFDCKDLETLRKKVEKFWDHYRTIVRMKLNR